MPWVQSGLRNSSLPKTPLHAQLYDCGRKSNRRPNLVSLMFDILLFNYQYKSIFRANVSGCDMNTTIMMSTFSLFEFEAPPGLILLQLVFKSINYVVNFQFTFASIARF